MKHLCEFKLLYKRKCIVLIERVFEVGNIDQNEFTNIATTEKIFNEKYKNTETKKGGR